MRISCTVPTAGPLATRENIVRLGTLIDRLGYDTIWVSDHIVIPRRVESRYPYNQDGTFGTPPDQPYYEPSAVMGVLAGATQRARIGTSVLVLPYRNPVLLAKTVASLDDLSGGRITLGVGVGWMREEFALLGLPGEYFTHRGAVGDEWIQILRLLWTEENPRFAGRFHQFGDLGFLPKPVQKPHPPILIGGNTRPALRRAARYGDGWQGIGLMPEEVATKRRELNTLCEEAGRDPAELQISFRITIRLIDDPNRGGPSQEPTGLTLFGTPAQLVDLLGPYRAAGVAELGIAVRGVASGDEAVEMIERFATEVMPKIS